MISNISPLKQNYIDTLQTLKYSSNVMNVDKIKTNIEKKSNSLLNKSEQSGNHNHSDDETNKKQKSSNNSRKKKIKNIYKNYIDKNNEIIKQEEQLFKNINNTSDPISKMIKLVNRKLDIIQELTQNKTFLV